MSPEKTRIDARQDMLEYYVPASDLINAEIVYFDFDDTLARHHPDSQYWVALHTLLVTHDSDRSIPPSQFVQNFELASSGERSDMLEEYMARVRAISYRATGNADQFEIVADAFRQHPNDGRALKEAIKTIPTYPSSGMFWEARARLLRAEGVPPSFGMELMPGILELVNQLRQHAKEVCVISNSRTDLVMPALDDLFPNGSRTFAAVIAVGGTEVQIKPSPDPYEQLLALNPSLRNRKSVYIGNSQEDVRFAENIGLPVMIFGSGDEIDETIPYVDNVAALTRVIRQHVDAASLSRFAMQEQTDLPAADGRIHHDLSPAEVRSMAAEGLKRLWGASAGPCNSGVLRPRLVGRLYIAQTSRKLFICIRSNTWRNTRKGNQQPAGDLGILY